MEELPLPTCAIQLLGKVLSTDEAALVELRKAEAAHRTHNYLKPCVCREQQLETGVSQ